VRFVPDPSVHAAGIGIPRLTDKKDASWTSVYSDDGESNLPQGACTGEPPQIKDRNMVKRRTS
jgi:hypothetical protein